MSKQKTSPEQNFFGELQRRNLEAALQLAELSLNNAHQLMALQTELAKGLLGSAVDNVRAQTDSQDIGELIDLRSRFAQESTQQIMSTATRLAQISNEARNEFAQLLSQQLASGNQDLSATFQDFLKNLPNANQNLVGIMEQAITSANQAFEQMSQSLHGNSKPAKRR